MRRLMRRPSPAMAVALLALFVALGGTSVAANRLTGADIRGIRGVDMNADSFMVEARDGGPDVPILSAGGFRFLVHCDLSSATGSHIVVRNVSAGSDSQLDDNLNGDDEADFDQGDELNVNYSRQSTGDIENSAFSAVGSEAARSTARARSHEAEPVPRRSGLRGHGERAGRVASPGAMPASAPRSG